MDDKRISSRSQRGVSRHTVILQKAKENDAKRFAAADEGEHVHAGGGETRSIRPPQRKTFRVPGGEDAGQPAAESKRDSVRRVSGRTVVVRRSGELTGRVTVGTRATGRPASVRVTGGDTIIRYQSGDMVIMRGARRASLRRQLIWAYALGYLLLFGLFVFFLITGTTTMTPEAYIQRAFAKRQGDSVADLERAAMEVMRGSRTPAEVRLAQNLTFHDENKDTIHVESGDRLTLLTGAKLGKAIIEDLRLPPERRTFAKPFVLYKETYLANMRWPFWLTLYNSIGFFLLVIVFLWNPIREYLGTQAKKTAVALRNSREAQDTAQEIRNRYRQLASDIEVRRAALREQTEEATETERAAAMADAKRQAASVEGTVKTTLEVEENRLFRQLEAGVSDEACGRARRILEERLGQKEHDIAIDELIADISAMRPASVP